MSIALQSNKYMIDHNGTFTMFMGEDPLVGPKEMTTFYARFIGDEVRKRYLIGNCVLIARMKIFETDTYAFFVCF